MIGSTRPLRELERAVLERILAEPWPSVEAGRQQLDALVVVVGKTTGFGP